MTLPTDKINMKTETGLWKEHSRPLYDDEIPLPSVPTLAEVSQNENKLNLPHRLEPPTESRFLGLPIDDPSKDTGNLALLEERYAAVKVECEEFKKRRDMMDAKSQAVTHKYMRRHEGAPPSAVDILADGPPTLASQVSIASLKEMIREQELRIEKQHLTLKKHNVCRQISHYKNSILKQKLCDSERECRELGEKLSQYCRTITELRLGPNPLVENGQSYSPLHEASTEVGPEIGLLGICERNQQQKLVITRELPDARPADENDPVMLVQKPAELAIADQLYGPPRSSKSEAGSKSTELGELTNDIEILRRKLVLPNGEAVQARLESAELVKLIDANNILRHQVVSLNDEATRAKLETEKEENSLHENLERLQLVNTGLEQVYSAAIKNQQKDLEIYAKKCKKYRKTIAHVRHLSTKCQRRAGSSIRKLKKEIAELRRKIKSNEQEAELCALDHQRKVTRLGQTIEDLELEVANINKNADENKRTAANKILEQQLKINSLEIKKGQLEGQVLLVTHQRQQVSEIHDYLNFAFRWALLSLTMSSHFSSHRKAEQPRIECERGIPGLKPDPPRNDMIVLNPDYVIDAAKKEEQDHTGGIDLGLCSSQRQVESDRRDYTPEESNIEETECGKAHRIDKDEYEMADEIKSSRIREKTHNSLELEESSSPAQSQSSQTPAPVFKEVEQANPISNDETICYSADEGARIVRSKILEQPADTDNSTPYHSLKYTFDITGGTEPAGSDDRKQAAIREALRSLTGKSESPSSRQALSKLGCDNKAQTLGRPTDTLNSKVDGQTPYPGSQPPGSESADTFLQYHRPHDEHPEAYDDEKDLSDNQHSNGKREGFNHHDSDPQEWVSRALIAATRGHPDDSDNRRHCIERRNGMLDFLHDFEPTSPEKLSITPEHPRSFRLQPRSPFSRSTYSASTSLCAIISKGEANNYNEDELFFAVDDVLSKNLALDIETQYGNKVGLRLVSAPTKSPMRLSIQTAPSIGDHEALRLNTADAGSHSYASGSFSTSMALSPLYVRSKSNESFGDLLGGMLYASITENALKLNLKNFKMSQFEIKKSFTNPWPPHNKLITYSPRVFASLRAIFKIDEDNFLSSLGGTFHRKRGLDGISDIYHPSDKGYILQPITRSELYRLSNMLWPYHTYMKANPNSLLPQYYGMYWARVHDGKGNHQTLYFLLMNNVINTSHKIDKLSQFCGSAEEDVQRLKGEGHLSGSEWIDNSVDMEITLIQQKLLLQQFTCDIKFLKGQNARNYKLLVAVRRPHKLHNPRAATLKGRDSPNVDNDNDLGSLFCASRVFQHHDGGLRGNGGDLAPIYYIGIVDCLKANAGRLGWSTRSIQAAMYGDRIIEFFAQMLDAGNTKSSSKVKNVRCLE